MLSPRPKLAVDTLINLQVSEVSLPLLNWIIIHGLAACKKNVIGHYFRDLQLDVWDFCCLTIYVFVKNATNKS